VGYLAVIASYISPDTVFLFLLNSSGAVILFVYLLIAASELVLRSKTPDDCLKIKMWGFPVLTLATIAAMVAVLAMMAFQEEARRSGDDGLPRRSPVTANPQLDVGSRGDRRLFPEKTVIFAVTA
jgi:amino acid transporter